MLSRDQLMEMARYHGNRARAADADSLLDGYGTLAAYHRGRADQCIELADLCGTPGVCDDWDTSGSSKTKPTSRSPKHA